MKNIIGIRSGLDKPHKIHQIWFESIGIKKTYPFNMTSSRKILWTLRSLNQILGFTNSIFLPNAKYYLVESTGCVSAVILKKKLFGSKIIAINSDTFYADLEKARGIKKTYMFWLAKHVDGLVSTSSMIKELANKFIDKPNKVVFPFLNVNKFKKINPDYKSNNICAIGLESHTKGTDILFRAFKKLHEKNKTTKLFVCGHKELLKNIKVPVGCELPGFVNPVPYLKKSSIYINAAKFEAFGVNILEAMCAGIPTIVTNRCGASEIVKKIDDRLVVESDVNQITKIAFELQNDFKLRGRLGKKLKQEALKYTKQKSTLYFRKTVFELIKNIKNEI